MGGVTSVLHFRIFLGPQEGQGTRGGGHCRIEAVVCGRGHTCCNKSAWGSRQSAPPFRSPWMNMHPPAQLCTTPSWPPQLTNILFTNKVEDKPWSPCSHFRANLSHSPPWIAMVTPLRRAQVPGPFLTLKMTGLGAASSGAQRTLWQYGCCVFHLLCRSMPPVTSPPVLSSTVLSSSPEQM